MAVKPRQLRAPCRSVASLPERAWVATQVCVPVSIYHIISYKLIFTHIIQYLIYPTLAYLYHDSYLSYLPDLNYLSTIESDTRIAHLLQGTSKTARQGTFGWHVKRGVWKKNWTSIKLQHGVNICKYAVPETRYIKIHISKLQKSNISTSQKSKNVSQNPNLHFRTIRSWSSHHAPSHSCTEPEDVRWNAPSKTWLWTKFEPSKNIQKLGVNHCNSGVYHHKMGLFYTLSHFKHQNPSKMLQNVELTIKNGKPNEAPKSSISQSKKNGLVWKTAGDIL